MIRNLKAILAIILFLSVSFLSCFVLNSFVLEPKYYEANSSWPTTSTYRQFYSMKKNSIDALFLGSSMCVNSFNPQQLYNKYHIRSYNLGSEQQSIFLSYYWLKEALRFQRPKAVVLEPLFLFSLHPESPINTTEGITRKCLDPMRFSSVKAEAVRELCSVDRSQTELSYYFTNIRFHSRWKSLKREDFHPDYTASAPLKGYSGSYDNVSTAEYEPFDEKNVSSSSSVSMPDLMKTYLDRMVELCSKNGIDLILVSTPNDSNDKIHNSLKYYAALNGLHYYDLGERTQYEQLGIIAPKEVANGHANVLGAVKITDYIGKILKEQYGIPSVEDAQWEETDWYYQKILLNDHLAETADLHEYFSLIPEGNYTVFISVKDDAFAGLDATLKEDLKCLGIQTDLSSNKQSSFYAVINTNRHTALEQVSGSRALSASGRISDLQIPFSISSAGHNVGNSSSIKVDGKEYSKSLRGFNIVVFDNDIMRVIDSVNFDTSSPDITVKR